MATPVRNYDDALEICRDEYEDLVKTQGQVDALRRVIQSDNSTFIDKAVVAAIMNFGLYLEVEG